VNEQTELAKLMATAAQRLQPECDKVRDAYVQTRAANLAARTGCTLKEAARVIARQCAGVLLPAVELAFDDPSLTGKTVADVLANPAAFEGCTLADPIEGIAYGRTKAMVLRRRDGTVFINSFAHGGMQYELRDDSSLPAALRNMLSLADNGAGNFYSFIRAALSQTIADDLIVEACCDQSYGGAINKHVIAKGGADYVKRQIESAANEPPTDHKGRTLIAVLKGRTDETWRATQDALIAHGCPIYVRGNRLVQPLWRWERADRERSVLIARFEILNVPRLTDIVSHHAVQFQKYDGRSRKLEDIDPPKDVISQLLEARHWLFPTVVGIINAPTMREDGSLLTEQGYDPQTKLWHKSSGAVTLPNTPECPTKAEALAALAKLNELLVGFPFAKQKEEETGERCVARSVALAGMMTTALRGALPVAVPLFLITATEPRTGKTYLVHIIAMLATGHIPPSTAGASEERPDEIEKRIETAAMSGRPIMHLNNLPNGMVLDSARLAELCTEGHVNIRKLGKHEEGLCDCRATTVFLNGNNIRVAGDLVPRTLLCRLNANREDPETRTFDSDPIAQVRKDRGAYLAAIFTIVRAYKAAGCPVPTGMHSVAGFEDWSSLVQQPLMWLGMADPFGEITSMRAMDPTLEELTNLVNVLRNTFKEGEKFTVAMCQKKADEQSSDNHGRSYYIRQDLRDLMTFNGKLNTKSFGRLLGRHLERIKDGWYYEPAGRVHGAAAYVLVRVPGQGQPQPPAQEEPHM
jgi:putative DNA primase/helicase